LKERKGTGRWRGESWRPPIPSGTWFVSLAQQCAEKYVKAFLEEQSVPCGKTHDLVVLVRATRGLLPELDAQTARLARLTTFGVAARYPGLRADQEAACEAMRTAEAVRIAVRAGLGYA